MYGLSAGSILLYLLLLCYYDGGFFASFTLGPSMGLCLSGMVLRVRGFTHHHLLLYLVHLQDIDVWPLSEGFEGLYLETLESLCKSKNAIEIVTIAIAIDKESQGTNDSICNRGESIIKKAYLRSGAC